MTLAGEAEAALLQAEPGGFRGVPLVTVVAPAGGAWDLPCPPDWVLG